MSNYNDIFRFAESFNNLQHTLRGLADNPLQELITTQDRLYQQLVAPLQSINLGIQPLEAALGAAALVQSNITLFEMPFLQEPQILHTMQEIPLAVVSPLSSYSSPFIDQLNDITVGEDYVDIPNGLYSAIEISSFKDYVRASPVNDKKSRFSLDFFLSCVLPNIIALWGVLLTIYYHNIDNKPVETISKDEYTQILEEAFTSAISSLFERLQINIPASSDIPLASPSCPSENLSSAKSDDPALSDTHEFDNPDMHQSPEQ